MIDWEVKGFGSAICLLIYFLGWYMGRESLMKLIAKSENERLQDVINKLDGMGK